MNTRIPRSTDPDFTEKMMRVEEEERCQRALIPHLSDETLLQKYFG
jgi:hypothetical protein